MTSDNNTIVLDPYQIKFSRIKDSSLFREAALRFEKFGYYTAAPKGTSAYIEYWKEEKRRCREGYVTSNGDFISGYFYFYLNYCPIILDKYNPRTQRTERTTGFPRVYDYDWYYYNAVEEAERRGKHLVVIKKRGAGYSFKGGSMLARNYYMYPKSKSYAIAEEAEFLTKDGLLTKAWDFMDFIDQNTAFAKKRQKKNTIMHRRASYEMDKDGIKIEKGYKSEIIGVTLKNDPQKARGKRGKLILWEEAGKFKGLKTAWQVARPSVEGSDGIAYGLMIAYGCVCEGTKLITSSGDFKKVEDICKSDGIIGYNTYNAVPQEITHFREPYETECFKITTSSGRSLECSHDHPIVHSHCTMSKRVPGKRKENLHMKSWKWEEAKNFKVGDQVGIIDEVPVFGKKQMWNPRLIGWLIGDGSYGFNKTPILSNCDKEINDYIDKHFDTVVEKSYTTKDNKLYRETRLRGICQRLRNLGIYGQTRDNKRLPELIYTCTKKDVCELLGGLFDADGYISYPKNKTRHIINLTSAYKELLLEVQQLLLKLGIHGKINFIKPSTKKGTKDVNGYYRLEIGDTKSMINFVNNIKLYPKHKAERVESYKESLKEKRSEISKYIHGLRFERVIAIESIGIKKVYNLTASDTNTYVANGFVTHNTGGTNDVEYESLKDLFYEPDVYNVLPIENVWDDGASKPCSFFVPQYYNMGDQFMDEHGNSKVKEAIKFELAARELIMMATDKNAVDRYVAEKPFTPQEATLQISSNIFPKAELSQQLSMIRTNKKIQEQKQVGKLVFNSDNKLEWKQSKIPDDLTKYKLEKKTDTSGSIVIWEHPDATPPHGLYIAGCDPYDHDKSGTNSLGSTFIYKRYQNFESYYDIIVAEYTGRPQTANDYYENVRRLLLYYNARLLYENERKGILPYFEQKHQEYLLADQPDVINDMIQNSSVKRSKGIHMVKGIKDSAEGWLRDWLIEKRGDGKLNLHTILSEPLLEELINYNDSGNFDRVMALMMVIIFKEELHNIKVKENKSESRRVNFLKTPIFAQN